MASARYQHDIRELAKQAIYKHQQWIFDPPTPADVKDALKTWYPQQWQTLKTGTPEEVGRRAGVSVNKVYGDIAPAIFTLLAEAKAIYEAFTEELGFEHWGTGGGCDTYIHNLPGDPEDPPHMMVTDEDASIPLYWDQEVVFGYYPSYGEGGEIQNFKTTRQLVDDLRAGKVHAKWKKPAGQPATQASPLPADDVEVVNAHRRKLGQDPLDPDDGWSAREIADMARNIRRHGRTHNPAALKRKLMR